jgi:hypothetical protein
MSTVCLDAKNVSPEALVAHVAEDDRGRVAGVGAPRCDAPDAQNGAPGDGPDGGAPERLVVPGSGAGGRDRDGGGGAVPRVRRADPGDRRSAGLVGVPPAATHPGAPAGRGVRGIRAGVVYGERFGGRCVYACRAGSWDVYVVKPNQGAPRETALAWLENRAW